MLNRDEERNKKGQQIHRRQRGVFPAGHPYLNIPSHLLGSPASSPLLSFVHRFVSFLFPFLSFSIYFFFLFFLTVHLEPRQMSGIRLCHLSVTRFVSNFWPELKTLRIMREVLSSTGHAMWEGPPLRTHVTVYASGRLFFFLDLIFKSLRRRFYSDLVFLFIIPTDHTSLAQVREPPLRYEPR